MKNLKPQYQFQNRYSEMSIYFFTLEKEKILT